MSESLRVVVVDRNAINREGTRAALSGVSGVEVVACYNFPEAMAVDDWSSADWVMSDICCDEDGPAGGARIIPLAERIRELCRKDHPRIIAVTSNPRAATSPVMMQRLLAADSDMRFMWRAHLDEQLKAVGDSRDLDQLLCSLGMPEPVAEDSREHG